MKRLLTAAAALSLIAGVAMAQTNPSNSPATTPSSDTPTPSGQTTNPIQDPTHGTSTVGASGPDASAAAPASPGADMSMGAAPAAAPSAAPAAGAGAMDTSAAQAADTPSAAPASYPKCTHKGQDRCTQAGAASKKKG